MLFRSDLTVEEIIKNNSFSPIISNSNITVTRQGGAVLLNGHIIKVIDKRFKSFQISKKYCIFLKFLPSTNSYTSVNSQSSYQLDGNDVVSTTEETTVNNFDNRTNEFINYVRNINCSKEIREDK